MIATWNVRCVYRVDMLTITVWVRETLNWYIRNPFLFIVFVERTFSRLKKEFLFFIMY